MKILRRLLGVFVMIAGILGLLLSLAGLVGLWVVRPRLVNSANSTISILINSIDGSQRAMDVTSQALGATVDSVDGLSNLLGATAASVQDSQPVITQLNEMLGKQLPSTFQATTDSLSAAQEAAKSLESAIKSMDTFRAVIGTTPFLSAFMPPAAQSYNPKKPLADSLGELSLSLKDMPATFHEMATNIDKADNNLTVIQDNLATMSSSTAQISSSLREYQSMITQSQASMDNLKTMLTNTQSKIYTISTWVTLALGLFFIWLLVAQVVIFSQGWEIFRGSAGRMESSPVEREPAVSA